MLKLQVPTMAADDPRQYMLNENLEIYEKVGVPSGALEMHFHNFYEIMYIIEGEFTILVNNTNYVLNSGDFILTNIIISIIIPILTASTKITKSFSKKYLEPTVRPSYELDRACKWIYPAAFPTIQGTTLRVHATLCTSADDNMNKQRTSFYRMHTLRYSCPFERLPEKELFLPETLITTHDMHSVRVHKPAYRRTDNIGFIGSKCT